MFHVFVFTYQYKLSKIYLRNLCEVFIMFSNKVSWKHFHQGESETYAIINLVIVEVVYWLHLLYNFHLW